MYLVSIYFDEKTDKRIREYIRHAAKRSGNLYMTEGNVPPHITISAFEIRSEDCRSKESVQDAVISALNQCVGTLQSGTLQWASVGAFFPGVLFLAPVLNEYLQNLSEKVYESLISVEGVEISRYYRPFQWLPHTTVAKKLTGEQMQEAFKALQEGFGMFFGEVVRVGLAKTNPYRDIVSWELKNQEK